MKQSRINQLKPLKIAVDAVRNARRNERDSFLALINTRPDDEKYQSTNQSWQSWKGAIYDAVKVFAEYGSLPMALIISPIVAARVAYQERSLIGLTHDDMTTINKTTELQGKRVIGFLPFSANASLLLVGKVADKYGWEYDIKGKELIVHFPDKTQCTYFFEENNDYLCKDDEQ